MQQFKRGRLNKQEIRFIIDNNGKMPLAEIAKTLNRTEATVQETIDLSVPRTRPTGGDPIAEREEKVIIRQELRNSQAWQNLKKEFNAEEIDYFEESYIKLMTQFKGDVLPSEETQILQAIKFEMLMHRNLEERRRAREDITRLEKMQENFLHGAGDDPSNMEESQREFLLNLESQLNAARTSEQSRTNEYVKLQERHEALMKALKGVRDQRVKQFESAKVSFLSVIKMLQERDVQEREGRQMELMKMAGDKEYVRLGRPTKYENNEEDSPILSADTVDLGPENADDADAEN